MTHDSGTAVTPRPSARGPVVLIVDDDSLVLETLVLQARQCGFSPLGESTAAGAIALCETERPAIAIIDYRMPGCGGDQLAEELTRRFGTRCILLTGTDDEETRLAASRAGVALYLVKPVDTATLLRSVSAMLEER